MLSKHTKKIDRNMTSKESCICILYTHTHLLPTSFSILSVIRRQPWIGWKLWIGWWCRRLRRRIVTCRWSNETCIGGVRRLIRRWFEFLCCRLLSIIVCVKIFSFVCIYWIVIQKQKLLFEFDFFSRMMFD